MRSDNKPLTVSEAARKTRRDLTLYIEQTWSDSELKRYLSCIGGHLTLQELWNVEATTYTRLTNLLDNSEVSF